MRAFSMRSLPSALSILPLAAALVFPASVAARSYEAIKGESALTYVLKHPAHTVKGVTRDFECAVELSGDTVSSKIRVGAQVKTFDSGNSNRDSHAMEAIHALKYPRVSFESDSVRQDGEGYRVSGKLAFHGVTRPVAFRVKPETVGDRVRITGAFTVKLSDFGVKRPSLMFVKTSDDLSIRFDLFAKP
jgi:polyisoprenoid-binding protein YceI